MKKLVGTLTLDRLAASERQIRAFVETYMVDECGLVYSFMNARTLKPWTDAELKAYNLKPVCHPNINSPADYYAYENSLMGTGEYAASQVARYEATGEGEALATAGHQIGAIMQVFEQGALFEKGFLPKPFGGVRRCAYSHELSPDQHIKVLVAMRAFQPYAPPSLKRRMDEYIVALADYHMARGFIHPRRESFVVTPENRPHVISILVPVLVCAHNITGQARYRDALSRFDEILDRYAGGTFDVHFNLTAITMEGLHLAVREGLQDKRLKSIIRLLWERQVPEVTGSGLGYVDRERTRLSSESLRMAGLAPIVDGYFPDLHACRLGLFVLQKLRNPRRMLYVNKATRPIDYHGPLSESICELAVGSWLLGYWRMRNGVCAGNTLP